MLWNKSAKNRRDLFFCPIWILERQKRHFTDTSKLYFHAKQAPNPYIGTEHTLRWKQDRLHVSWHEDLFLLTPICPVWGHLVLNCSEGSFRSTDGGVAVEKNLNFIHHLRMCVYVHVLSTHALVCTCVYFLNLAEAPTNRSIGLVRAVLLCQLLGSPLTQVLLGSLGTQECHPLTPLRSPGPVKRKSDIMKAGQAWQSALPTLAPFSQAKFWDHSIQDLPVLQPSWAVLLIVSHL